MSEPTPVRANPDAELREAWVYLTPHWLTNGPVVLDGPKMRAAIATLRAERDQLAELVGEYAAADVPDGMEKLAKDRDRWFDLATAVEAERDQLTADLRKAVIQAAEHARARGEAEGRLRASEMAGVVEGWREQNERLAADLHEAREALKPFSDFGADNVDEEGWNGLEQNQTIYTWFGPSDFRAARDALSDSRPSPAKGGDHHG